MSNRNARSRRPKPARPGSNRSQSSLSGRDSRSEGVQTRGFRPGRVPVIASLVIFVLLALFWGMGTKFRRNRSKDSAPQYLPRPQGTLTYTRDIAPILFQRCADCHRPDEAAPFSLLNYEQTKKHARQIAEATAHGYMPPWPPEHGYGEFADE